MESYNAWPFVWLLSLSMFPRSIHVVACVSTSFLSTAEYCSIRWMCCIGFTLSSADGRLGWIHLWANVNSDAVNIHVDIVWVSVFSSSGYIPRDGIAGSFGNSLFSLLRKPSDRFVTKGKVWLYFRKVNVANRYWRNKVPQRWCPKDPP